MPVYEYACDRCGAEFEREQRITEDPIKTCPECRSRKVKRLISKTSFVLRGSGWYSDLYSSAKPGKSDGKDASASGTESESSGKSETKKSDSPSDQKSKKKKGSKAAA